MPLLLLLAQTNRRRAEEDAAESGEGTETQGDTEGITKIAVVLR